MKLLEALSNIENLQNRDAQISELVANMIADEEGLSEFVLAVEKASLALDSKDYPLPPGIREDRRGAAIYEGYRLGAEWMLKLATGIKQAEPPPAFPIEQLIEWLRSDAIPLAFQDGCNKAADRLKDLEAENKALKGEDHAQS